MSTSALVCLFIIVTIVEAAIEGARKGLLAIISPAIAFVLALSVAGTGNAVLGSFTEKISTPAYETAAFITEEILNNTTPEDSKLDEIYSEDSQMQTIFDIEGVVIEEIREELNKDNSKHARNIVSFVILYAVASVALHLFIEIVTKGLVISIADRGLGVVAGVIISVLKMWFLMLLITVIGAYVPSVAEIQQKLMESSLYSHFYMMNPIL